MFRLLVVAMSLSFVAGCKTADAGGAEAKDLVTFSGPVTKHYYAVGNVVHRALCPFGLDSEDTATYRAQCQISRTMELEPFTENLEKAYMDRFKDGDPLNDDENLIGGLMVQGLADPNVMKANFNQPAHPNQAIAMRFAQVFEQAFGFPGGPGDTDGGGVPGTPNDSGSLILTTSFVAPFGVSTTPAVISQNPVTTNAVTVQVNGCQAQVIGMAIAEGPEQPLLTMGSSGVHQFATISGQARKFARIQLVMNSLGGFCQVKVTSAGTGGGGGGSSGDAGQLGPETQIGVMQYNGGFVPQLVAPLNPPRLVKQFRVGVPPGCQADVVKGGILTAQQVAPTTLIDPASHVYRVNNGLGAVAIGVSISLSGPLGFCQIPVFVR